MNSLEKERTEVYSRGGKKRNNQCSLMALQSRGIAQTQGGRKKEGPSFDATANRSLKWLKRGETRKTNEEDRSSLDGMLRCSHAPIGEGRARVGQPCPFGVETKD